MSKDEFFVIEATVDDLQGSRDEDAAFEIDQNVDTSIPLRYRGTNADRKDMYILGKKQVLRRNFNFYSMVGFASTAVVSWEVLLTTFSFILVDGGAPLLFWGEIAVIIGMALVYASLSEVASMAPTAGGQYHWASEFAPPKYQKGLSYAVGWLSVMGWQAFLAAGLIAFNDESYIYARWHGTLLTIAVISFAILFNTFLAAKLPMIEGCILVVHVAGFFAIIIPLWIMAPRAPVNVALFDFQNNGGWSSLGLSAMVGMATPLSSLIGYDCSMHMAEEIKDASYNLPKAIMWSTTINAVLALGTAVTIVFTMGDVDSLLSTNTGWPLIQLFYNATQSSAGVNCMVTIITFMYCACSINEIATSSRQLWSFARDSGLPASTWLSVVPPGYNLPIRSVLVSFIIACLLACINIGSTVALNAINAFALVPLLASYIIVIGCVIWRRLAGAPLPPRRWSLGRYGLAVNIASVCFLAPLFVFAFFPLATPVEAASMNWSSLIFGGVLLIAGVRYVIRGKREYSGPVVVTKREPEVS